MVVGHDRVDESSLRYVGWRVVLACFLVALFIFGFGLYGHAVYLAELQRLHGWSTAFVSIASTLSLDGTVVDDGPLGGIGFCRRRNPIFR